MQLVDLLQNHKIEFQKFLETGNLDHIYKNKLDEACFQLDKDLKRRTKSDMVLRDKAYNIANDNSKDLYQRGLASMVYKFFDKKTKS